MTRGVQPPADAPCPTCGRQDRRLRPVTAEATHGTVAVLADGLPVEVCACGAAVVSAEVRRATESAGVAALPRAHRRRLRADRCEGCGAVLTMPVRRTTRAVTAQPMDAPVATLTFDLPMQRCGDCGHDQVPVRSRADIAGAVDAVVTAAIAVARSSQEP